MSEIFFSGIWQGQYTYGPEYGYKKTVSTSFEINMTVKDGVVTGSCTDDKTAVPMPEAATIEGFIEGNLISFMKRYPHNWRTDENGKVTIDLSSPSSYEIHYSGTYENNVFTGEWEIVSATIVDRMGRISETRVTGTWAMKQTSA